MKRDSRPKKLRLLEEEVNNYLNKYTYERLSRMTDEQRQSTILNDTGHIIDKYYSHIDLTDSAILSITSTQVNKIRKIDLTMLIRLYTDPNLPTRDYHSFIDKTYHDKGGGE